jgi:hypothetical protein
VQKRGRERERESPRPSFLYELFILLRQSSLEAAPSGPLVVRPTAKLETGKKLHSQFDIFGKNGRRTG